ncbi:MULTISPECIES: phosphoethanolamine--lipid A transferase EptA [Flavobacterium]|uniref:Lipid A phosphoethanolamine transferase-like protein n=2 Tax=Flavobacterium johnsoniae TaxID=986 RepID=A5FFF7_FLAJ1|nr:MULTISPECIES: phosphoethanolamine--lipid A transferase EptA [Flavobacterium]ABQ06067.1 lipid A phosphoethanolamine transferase-like protein [Flavobacterium johnsoniae UW101]EJG02209.1 lipid A phosphoethanolamine transferase [Flavobacterium sp. F52]OXG00566.1 phosphoethanolamine transferase [Flavobacterium johnsoniae UW101]WQG81810.1 phosphoethanolamine--lipid A transferase EptA [Flavobacterium johnsoniae UW101]SHK64878.1 lipid A ethanolaminephosphotransferase [Flavobacterium johnsoniae]
MLKGSLPAARLAALASLANCIFFHIPFFAFVVGNLNYAGFSGMMTIASLILLMLVLDFLVFYLLVYLAGLIGRIIISLFFALSAAALYFINAYSVIIDESMIGNILNTNYAESSAYFSITLALYVLVLGILPSAALLRIRTVKEPLKRFAALCSGSFLIALALVFINSAGWLWIDKNSKKLGGLAMPWSYAVNTTLFYVHQYKKNQKEILLPDARISSRKKSIVVLVIGESARKANFSLYGYPKNTNPMLADIENVHPLDAVSAATYTTAGVKAILDYKKTDELYEILPNYLFRNNVEVIWRTANWGEPPLHIKNYQDRKYLGAACRGKACGYDEILLALFKEQILASRKDKILLVLHTSTSHGPNYSAKYPAGFRKFSPVCSSVELADCSKQELMNAYDNTIVYTDYLLSRVIQNLKELKEFDSTMIFVSDHGESLGENNLYMHGLPMSIAPKEQFEIPFIVWASPGSKKLKANKTVTQYHVFHSVLNFLDVESPIYDENMNIYR